MAKKAGTAGSTGRPRTGGTGPRRTPQGRRRQTRLLRLGIGAVIAVLLLAVFLSYEHGTSSTGSVVAASASLGPVTTARPASPTGSFRHVSAPLLQGKKPLVLFIGAQYCPFCAAERWSLVKALSHFGAWSGLAVGHSSAGQDGFGDVPTFDLLQAHYTSRYVAFESRDVADNSGSPLQTLTAQQQALLNQYDPAGSIPMVYLDGYVLVGSDYSPAVLQGRGFAAVQDQLQHGGSASYVQDINAEANLITSLLCQADGQQPAVACHSPLIEAMEHGLQ